MFWYCFCFQNTCIWLQWLGFEGKHAMLCIRGFNYQVLIRGHACFPTISHQKFIKSVLFYYFLLFTSLLNLCILQALCSYIWEISLFSLQKSLWATLLRVFCEISLISPQNLYVSCQMYFYFVLCLCSIKSLHKI